MKWIGLAVMLNMAPFVRATVDNNNPIANSKAVVICGNARFTVLTPEMIRIEYSEKGMFEDRPTFTVVNRNLELVDFKKKEDDRFLYIQTDKVKLKYRKGTNPKTSPACHLRLRSTFLRVPYRFRLYGQHPPCRHFQTSNRARTSTSPYSGWVSCSLLPRPY